MLYFSENKNIAEVSDTGVVTGKSNGTTIITVASAVNKKVKAKFTVTVKTSTVKCEIGDENYLRAGYLSVGYGYKKGDGIPFRKRGVT